MSTCRTRAQQPNCSTVHSPERGLLQVAVLATIICLHFCAFVIWRDWAAQTNHLSYPQAKCLLEYIIVVAGLWNAVVEQTANWCCPNYCCQLCSIRLVSWLLIVVCFVSSCLLFLSWSIAIVQCTLLSCTASISWFELANWPANIMRCSQRLAVCQAVCLFVLSWFINNRHHHCCLTTCIDGPDCLKRHSLGSAPVDSAFREWQTTCAHFWSLCIASVLTATDQTVCMCTDLRRMSHSNNVSGLQIRHRFWKDVSVTVPLPQICIVAQMR